MMNWKEFISGIVLYLLPVILLVVSIAVVPNALWVAISVTWIFTAMFYKVLTLPDDSAKKDSKGNY